MHYYQDANKNWYYSEREFGSGCYDFVYVSAGEIFVDEVQAAMDEGRGVVAGDDEVMGEAESEDDDPDYAHPVGLQAVLDSIAEMRMYVYGEHA